MDMLTMKSSSVLCQSVKGTFEGLVGIEMIS